MFGRGKSRYCEYCGRYTRVVWDWRGPSQWHLVLTLLTCGLWLPVAIWDASRDRYVCSRCGTHNR